MKRRLSLTVKILACALLCCSAQAFAQSSQPVKTSNQNPGSTGIVNFKLCVEESKLGKAEQAAFESLKSQMAAVLEKTEKDLEEIAAKLSDSDQLDALSPEAEEELKQNFQRLSQDLNRYQNQYYQILNQANFKVLNSLSTKVGEAAETIAKSKNLSIVLNEEACFYYNPELDITKQVIAELDRNYVAEAKTQDAKPAVDTPAPPKSSAKPAPAQPNQPMQKR